jgi:hypothetical protein
MSTTKKRGNASDGKGAAKGPDNELSKRDSPASGQCNSLRGAEPGNPARNGGDDWNGLIWNNLKLSADIPREMRDEIYSYLALSPESAKYTPTTDRLPKLGEKVDGIMRGPHSSGYRNSYRSGFTTMHTYAFNIAMLLVNQATKADVEQYIIKTNKFILVEYYVPLLRTMLSHCAVPIVADQHLGPCKVHSVRLRLEWNDPPGIKIVDSQERPSLECGRLLLTWNDFPKLCRMLKFMCQYTDPRALYITNDRNNQLSTQTGSSIRIEAPSLLFNIVRQLSSAKQTELVNNILTIVSGGYRLGIFGVPDDRGSYVSHQMRRIITSTGPHLIWAKALLWERLQTAFELKREADKLAENGHFRSAQRRFFSVVEYFTYEGETNLLDYFESPCEDTHSDGNRKALQRSWYGLRTDLCLSIAAADIIRTQANTVLTAASAARDYLRWLQDNRERSFSISDHELAQRVHMRALVHLACYKGIVLSKMLTSIPVRGFLENVQNFPEYATSRSRADYDTLCGLQQKLQQVT